MLKSHYVNVATATILSIFVPASGHFWLRQANWGYSVIAAFVLCAGFFCWSGIVFDPDVGYWLLVCLGLIYLVNVGSAAWLAWDNQYHNQERHMMWLIVPALFILFVLLIKFKGFIFGAQIFYIPSQSMEPTLGVGDFVLVDVRKRSVEQLSNGDILVFTLPDDSDYYIKRVIAKPGDKLRAFAGQLAVNDELKLSNLTDLEEMITTLSKDSYFVIGDNYRNSFDSRHWGFVKRSRLIGIYRYTLGNLPVAPTSD